MSTTISVLQRFMAAYNRHDLAATMAFFPRPFAGSDWMLDCDYAFLRAVSLETYGQVKAWIRARFAEDDHFDALQISANPADFTVGTLRARRTSTVLSAIGAAPLADPFGAKVAVDQQRGEVIAHMWFPGLSGCRASSVQARPLLSFPAGASLMRTRGIAQAFIDAYNDHNVGRILQLVAKHVMYRGCDWIHGRRVDVSGTVRLTRWLHILFADGDSYNDPTVSVTNPDRPDAARIQGQRTNHALRRQNRAPLATTVDVILAGPHYDRIGDLSTESCAA